MRFPAGRLRNVDVAPWLAATAGYVTALIAVTWPLAARIGHGTYGGPGDGWALIWQTRVRFDHGISYFSPTFVPNDAWPVGAHEVTSTLLSNATTELTTFALLLLGIGDVAAYNVVDLLGALVSALAMYGLLRRVGCRAGVSFWGGLAYLIAPWHLEKLAIHPPLASMACFPLLLLGIHDWTISYRLRSALLVLGAVALATYTHSYYALAAAAVLVVSAPLVLIRAHRQSLLGRAAVRTAALGAALVIVPVPLAIALAVQSAHVAAQLNRPLYLIDFAARPYLWGLPDIDNPALGGLSKRYIEDHALKPNTGELALFLGYLTVALAAIGVVTAARRYVARFDVALGGAVALAGVALSIPSTVDLPLVGPTRMPISYVGGIVTFISTPARFFVLTLTGAVLLAGLGLEALLRRLRQPWPLVAVGLACLISAVELPIRRDGLVFDTRPPQLVRAIEREVPDGEPVAQYPSYSQGFVPASNQLFYQLEHKHPVLAGAPASSTEDGVRDAVADPTAPGTASRLALLGYRWATFDAEAAGGPLADLPGFRVVRRLPDSSLVMRVVAKPAAAAVGLGESFSRADRWMTSERATLAACATRDGIHTLRLHAAAFGRPRMIRIGDARPFMIDTPQDRTVKIRLRAGWQEVPVRLIGSKPTRPSDVIPGYRDDRTLVMQVQRITISGPAGPPGPCRRGPMRSSPN